MVLHGSPISREDPAVARKRDRTAAELNDERGPAKNADLPACQNKVKYRRCRKGTGVTMIASSDHFRHSRTKMQC